MTEFSQFNLPQALMHKLDVLGFTAPTPIQEKAIPLALEGRDILGSAQTGTGKTGAFAIPMLAKILNTKECKGLIITPTRELATQVHDQIKQFLGAKTKIKSAVLIGGASIDRQIQSLSKKPRIIVGTPGRIIDHLERKSVDLSEFNYVVLDETDRMLDMGFSQPISQIFDHIGEDRQTLLFSATLPKNIQQLSAKYLNDHVNIYTSVTNSVSENIKQETVFLKQDKKFDALVSALSDHNGTAIVFMNSKFATEKMARRLKSENISAEAIHGDLRQNKRDRVIAGLRNDKYRVLVATDVAARGLDVPNIHQVINFDLPRASEDYIHRIGRTGRAGSSGVALNFVTPGDEKKMDEIKQLMDPDAKPTRSNNKPKQKRGRGKNKNWRNKSAKSSRTVSKAA